MELMDATAKSSHKGGRQSCQHEYKMNEEVGIICSLCNSVITEMRYVLPRFVSEFTTLRKKTNYHKSNGTIGSMTHGNQYKIFWQE